MRSTWFATDIVLLLICLWPGRPALALELGLTGRAANVLPVGRSKGTTLHALIRELGIWERRINHQDAGLSVAIDRQQPLRLSVAAPKGRLHLVVGETFLRDEVLFRALTSFMLGFSRYDRYGDKAWVERLGLAQTTIWKHYYGTRHFAEIVFNADGGSPLGRADAVEFWQAHLQTALEGAPAGGSREHLQALLAQQQATMDLLGPAINKVRRRQGQLAGVVKRRTSALTRQGISLEPLISGNRRAKVADLLETVVPLTDLEPFEQAFWKQQTELMRADPQTVPRLRLYRGLYSGTRYKDGRVILAPTLRDNVDDGKPALGALVSYFAERTWLGKAEAGHPGIIKTFRFLEKQYTSVAVNAMIVNHNANIGSSSFISLGTLDIASRFAKGRERRAEPRLGVYDIPKAQVLVPSQPRWPESEFLKFLFVFPSETAGVFTTVSPQHLRQRLGRMTSVSSAEEHRLRSRFMTTTAKK